MTGAGPGLAEEDREATAWRRAGPGALSLALIDARNRSLRWAAAFEAAKAGVEALVLPLARLGWAQEATIARNLERQRGEQGDRTRPRLPSVLPESDRWFDGAAPPPALQTVRQYLVDTLETTLELLDGAGADDAALHYYRLALFREEIAAERFAAIAQAVGIDTGLVEPAPPRPPREPIWLPATRALIGSPPGGFVPRDERWAHEVALPEFEIDAQAVSWAQYAEFVGDGGYDERRHWSEPGWVWLQSSGRRTPRYVEQMRQGVLQRRFGRTLRVPASQPAVHVAWFEADAWCRWAGRRLPAEAEWESAAAQAAQRGFRWGEVREWTAGTLRPYPGSEATVPAGARPDPAPRVLRGASFATPPRLRTATARVGAPLTDDEGFHGFRSCAI